MSEKKPYRCNNCGEEIRMQSTVWIHSESESFDCKYSSFYNSIEATPVILKRYTVTMHDGHTPSDGVPQRPTNANQVNSLGCAESMFRDWMIAFGNDYLRAEGYGNPYAWVYRSESWDGISYGDAVACFERGSRAKSVARVSL